MSCTPTSALSRSLSPLSPSDESRFVPRESVASAINEQHFTAAEKADKGTDTSEDAPGKGAPGVDIAEAVGVAGQDASKERAQDVDEDEKSGIVGATICFTPEPSPKSGPRPPPLFQDELPHIGSLTINTHSDDYIGSIAAAGSGSGGLVASSKMGSASMHVASSLDGRSTTEYELISKGSIEVEDLILEGEEDGGYGGSGGAKSGGGNVTPLASLSPCGTVPSLDEAPLEAFTGVAKAKVPAEINLKADTSPDDTAAEEETKSPKVDSSPLHPFKNLHKYWEAKSSNFAHMTKSTLGRFFGKESAQGADDVDVDDSEQAPVAEASKDDKPAVEADASADAIATTSVLPFAAAKAYLSGLAASAASFVASAFLLLAMLLRGSLSTWLESISSLVGRIMLRKRLVEAGKEPSSDAPTSAADQGEPQEPEGVNLSKLFADEAREKESEAGLEQVPAQPADAKEPELATATALEHSKKASLNKIVDLVTDFLAIQMKKALALLKTKQVLRVLTPLFVLATVFLLCVYMLRRGAGVAHEGEGGLLDSVTFEEEGLSCALTEATSYASIPVSELNLSPTFSDEDASARSGTSVWMWIFGSLSLVISVGCAFVFKSKLSSLIDKREASSITGIWAEFEHEQFLRGFRAHGKRWKLVSAYVPTRTPTQVRAHGSYWLKVRSPDGMKKSRRSSLPAMTPERSSLGAPGSVSSRKTTPRTSNKSKSATPKGILVEKRFKNVTPRSEERAKRMKKTEGPMSDPPKRRARIKST